MEHTVTRFDRSVLRSWAVALAQAASGAYFVMAGLLTLMDAPWIAKAFARWGWPTGARVALGLVELVGGILIVLPRFARASATVLAGVMVWSALVKVARVEPPIELLEPLLVTPLLIVVFNAFSPGNDFAPTRPRGDRGGSGGRIEADIARRRWTLRQGWRKRP